MRISKTVPALLFLSVFYFSCNEPAGKTAAPHTDTVADPRVVVPPQDSLVADTGNPADPQVAHIADLLRTQLVKEDLNTLPNSDRRFSYGEADLNGDHIKEVFVAMKGSSFCGSAGCTVFLLNSKGEKISRFTIVNGPIVITTDKTNGWYDLVIPSGGGRYRVKYNGKAYPGNPSVQPEFKGTLPAGLQTVLTDSAAVHDF